MSVRKILKGAALVGAVLTISSSAMATVLVAGDSAKPTQSFADIAATQGSVIASQTYTGQSTTFAAQLRQAVYRNTLGTLDFYFQVVRTGTGTRSDDEIKRLTTAAFNGYTVDAYASGAIDVDGAGFFTGAANPQLENGTASGSTTTFARSMNGNVVTAEFGMNGLSRTEVSAVYIYRTNAVSFNGLGTFGIIDGSTLTDDTYQPTGAPVPEPATWAMTLAGFGLLGGALRRKRQVRVAIA